jgi:tetrahydromethanopterin S-methyltransferase subunit H
MKVPYTLGRVQIGKQGKPVLIGSLFYKSDKKVTNHKLGEVDCRRLSRELKSVCALSSRVGLETAIDVIAETPKAMENYVDLLAGMVDLPLLIGGLNEESRVAGYARAKRLGIAGRCGVNSISTLTSGSELAAIKEAGIRFAVLQTLDPSAVYPEDKLRLLEESLLVKCSEAAIEAAAVDVGIIDFTSAYLAVESIKLIKSRLGLPAGCAPSNAAYQPLVSRKMTRRSARSVNVALNTMLQMGGADIIFYGPLRASTYLFEAAAVVEGIKAYGKRLAGDKAVDRTGPLFTFLPKLQ